MATRDRITVPAAAALDSERELAATTSDVRPLVPPFAVPGLLVTMDELRNLPLDPRAGHVVSLIDGRANVEGIADMSGIPLDEITTIFATLLELEAIELRDPR